VTSEQILCVEVEAAARDATTVRRELLQRFPAGIEERPRPSGVCFVVYANDEPELARIAKALRSVWTQRKRLGSIVVTAVRQAGDWQRDWARHLPPQVLSGSTRVVPVASARAVSRASAKDRGRTIYLLHARAFGFAEHATTRLMAGALEAHLAKRRAQSVLDVGTGTGVLAIHAARCGAQHSLGIDLDPVSVRIARANAKLNRVADRCRFSGQALHRVGGCFDLVLANLDLPTLISLGPDLVRLLAPEGTLLMSGVLLEHGKEVSAHMKALGLSPMRGKTADGWALLAFRAPTPRRARTEIKRVTRARSA
jgi:ribosomal protein L11 methylase PrmA